MPAHSVDGRPEAANAWVTEAVTLYAFAYRRFMSSLDGIREEQSVGAISRPEITSLTKVGCQGGDDFFAKVEGSAALQGQV